MHIKIRDAADFTPEECRDEMTRNVRIIMRAEMTLDRAGVPLPDQDSETYQADMDNCLVWRCERIGSMLATAQAQVDEAGSVAEAHKREAGIYLESLNEAADRIRVLDAQTAAQRAEIARLRALLLAAEPAFRDRASSRWTDLYVETKKAQRGEAVFIAGQPQVLRGQELDDAKRRWSGAMVRLDRITRGEPAFGGGL